MPFACPPFAVVHTSHGPLLQAVLQQYPFTQKPELHWSDAEHAAPWPAFAMQVPFEHQSPEIQAESLLHEVGHALSVPSQRYWPHPVPALPALTGEHVPTSPATVHESQPSVHVVLQQTPLTQTEELHCRDSVHGLPFIWAGSHWPAELQ